VSKTGNAGFFADGRDEHGGMRRQGELPLRVLTGNFPNRNSTEEDFVARVQDESLSALGKVGRICLEPQESAGVEEQFQADGSLG
jgi:hypothetical protein